MQKPNSCFFCNQSDNGIYLFLKTDFGIFACGNCRDLITCNNKYCIRVSSISHNGCQSILDGENKRSYCNYCKNSRIYECISCKKTDLTIHRHPFIRIKTNYKRVVLKKGMYKITNSLSFCDECCSICNRCDRITRCTKLGKFEFCKTCYQVVNESSQKSLSQLCDFLQKPKKVKIDLSELSTPSSPQYFPSSPQYCPSSPPSYSL
jgi:hypothetical protein